MSTKRRRIVRQRKVTRTFSLPETTDEKLELLQTHRPHISVSNVLCDCIEFAHTNNMYSEMYKIKAIDPISGNAPRPPRGRTSKAAVEGQLIAQKTLWLENFGGTVDNDGFATYTKYEKTATGEIVTMQRSEYLKEMPDNEDDFRKSILGSFISLNGAKRALAEQES